MNISTAIPVATPAAARRRPMTQKTVTLAHGGGGSAMRDLIDDVFLSAFSGEGRAAPEDQARFDLAALMARGDRLAFTTDGFVVDPLFFPGGDIGKLAVCGTVNDLAVGGATPVALSCAIIIEEGLEVDTLLDRDLFSRICYIQHQRKVYPVRIVGKQLPEEAQTAAQKKCARRRARIRQRSRNERCCMQTGCF